MSDDTCSVPQNEDTAPKWGIGRVREWTLHGFPDEGGVMARSDEDDLLSEAVELLRSRLPGRSEAELRAIKERSANRSARPASDEDC